MYFQSQNTHSLPHMLQNHLCSFNNASPDPLVPNYLELSGSQWPFTAKINFWDINVIIPPGLDPLVQWFGTQ